MRRLQEEFKDRVEFKALDIDNAANNEAKTKYKFRAQPQFVTVSAKGDVLSNRNGSQSYETLKKDIEAALTTK